MVTAAGPRTRPHRRHGRGSRRQLDVIARTPAVNSRQVRHSTLGIRSSGGCTWWAHFEFTRINIEPIILRKKIEDAREVSAIVGFRAAAALWP